MGTEYKLKFKYESRTDLASFLQTLPYFVEFEIESNMFNYRIPSNLQNMPNIAVQIEDEGLYLCDYGVGDMLASWLKPLFQAYGNVQIIDYES